MRPLRLRQPIVRTCTLAESDNNSLRSWNQFLNALEGQLSLQRYSLAERNSVLALPVAAWQPPQDLGALPESLAPRLQRLLDEIAELSEQFAARRRETVGQLRAVGQVPREEASVPVYLDSIG